MYFKDLKQDYTVYLFDKYDISVKQGKVISVGLPHFDNKNFNAGTKMVVDVSINVDGKTQIYTLKEDTDTGYTDSIVISTDRSNIIREIEMAKAQSEEVLSQVDEHTKRVAKYTEILAEFNPAIKEKQEIDQRFGKLEDSINEIKNLLQGASIQRV